MWNLDLDRVTRLIAVEQSLPRIAIETGTCRGNGTRALAKRFDRVVSIELSQELHDLSRKKLSDDAFANVELILGNSAETLPSVLDSLPASEAVFFFLDAHWSGDSQVNWESARWKGYGFDTAHLGAPGCMPTPEEQCPLLKELSAIVKHCRGRAYLLIDDMKNVPPVGPGLKGLEFPGEDWSHISRERVLELVKPRFHRLNELNGPSQWLLSLEAPVE